MVLADVTLYGTVLSMIERIELAVITELTFRSLTRPAPVDVLASGRLLKLGPALPRRRGRSCIPTAART